MQNMTRVRSLLLQQLPYNLSAQATAAVSSSRWPGSPSKEADNQCWLPLAGGSLSGKDTGSLDRLSSTALGNIAFGKTIMSSS